MDSKLDMTTVPPSDENQLRRPGPELTFEMFRSGMCVYAGPQPRQPIAPVRQCDSPGVMRPVGGSRSSPFTAGQRPDAQL